MLASRLALVTGSTSGIGLGIAKVLAGHGASVVLNGFGDVDAAIKEVEAVAQAGAAVRFVDADLLDSDAISACMSEVAGWGGADILVNNAGMQHVSSTQDFPLDAWDKVLSLNLTSAFRLTREALPGMLDKSWGRVVNVASVHGLVASKDKSAYVASKHGIVGFTKVVALETAGSGVTSNAICPGWVLTPLVQAQIDARAEAEGISVEEAKANLLKEKQPSGEFATPEEIGELAAFLSGPYSRQITGASIPVCGGWTAQ